VTNVPRSLRDALLAEAPLQPICLDGVVAAADGTRKFRFRTHDGYAIESVLIPDDKPERAKLTLCLSCQAGCAWGCSFCATATLGFGRHLSAGEMVEQLYWGMESAGHKPSNVVFMGMGEPLHNLDEVVPLSGSSSILGVLGCRPDASRFRPPGSCLGSMPWRRSSRHPIWPSRSTPRPTKYATGSCHQPALEYCHAAGRRAPLSPGPPPAHHFRIRSARRCQ